MEHTVGYRELERSAQKVAVYLQRTARPGDRVLLLFPPGLDYLTVFLGCLYSGVVAVPLYAPRPGAKLDRIAAVAESCRPTHVLTTDQLAEKLGETFLPEDVAGGPGVHTVEAMLTSDHELFRPVELAAGDLAFLQYTSGSTGRPKGVMVSHGNLVENETAITAGFGVRTDDVILSWLPMYHDMGLIGTALLPLFYGIPAVLLNTFAFVHDPMIWPTAIARFGATCSGGPNFAYQLLVDRYDPARLTGVDLSSWRVAFNGAEPVSEQTLRSFAARYAEHGFHADALYPCYGLAEATLFVSGAQPGAGHRTGLFDRGALEKGRLQAAAEGSANAVAIVSSGAAALGTTVVIRGEDGTSLPDDAVGEICVHGPSVAQGYWGEPVASEGTFRARVTGHQGTFLRTGDLGAVQDGQLYPVGRSKDLIIVAGRNFYPHDIESVGSSTPRTSAGAPPPRSSRTRGSGTSFWCWRRPATAWPHCAPTRRQHMRWPSGYDERSPQDATCTSPTWSSSFRAPCPRRPAGRYAGPRPDSATSTAPCASSCGPGPRPSAPPRSSRTPAGKHCATHSAGSPPPTWDTNRPRRTTSSPWRRSVWTRSNW